MTDKPDLNVIEVLCNAATEEKAPKFVRNDLLSCPFCGCRVLWNADNMEFHWIDCDECGASGPSHGETSDEANSNWNKRAGES